MNENTAENTAIENKSIWTRVSDYWSPYRLASAIFFLLFAGADVSLYLFGKSATGNFFIALVLTLLSGVGALVWKRQRDNKDSNETQRSIAMAMIVLHAVTAVVFMGGNFARGGWEKLAGQILIDGTLAKELVDYQVLIEKIFTWSIVVALSADLVALFVFMENDTLKKQDRLLAQMARDNRDAQLQAQIKENEIAKNEYAKQSDRFAQLKGLTSTRERLVNEFKDKVDANTLANMLADIDTQIAEVKGAIPVGAGNVDQSASAPFTQPSQTTK